MSQLSRAVTWFVVLFVVVSNAQEWPPCQDISQYQRGGCCLRGPGYEDLACPFPGDHGFLLPRQACTTDLECSTPNCAGGSRYSVCQDGACLCKSPTDGYGDNPPPTCSVPEECSLPDCTGDGKTVACEEGACVCKTEGSNDPPPQACAVVEECSLPDCVGDDKTVACEERTCTCKTTDDRPPEIPPTPTFVPTQITQEGGAVVSVVIIHGGPITAPITLTSAPEPTIDVAGDAFHSSVSSISSQVVTDILPLATAWADAPDPAKATAAVQSIEGLIPMLGEIAGGLFDGQRIFDCPELSAPAKRQDANELVSQLQKINCELLGILGALEQGQTSTDPAVVGPAQQEVHNGGNKIGPDLESLAGILSNGSDPPPQACTAVAECNLPDCTGDGKTIACEKGTCTCTDQDGNLVPETCSADAECTSLPDCEGDGKTKVCQGECICKTGDEAVVTTTLTALPPGASLQTITDVITENMVTTTTSEGSSDPTVVPIIVVLGKPPVICWGCVTFPANIQIKLPEFCVNILGFKIGNCPSNDNNDDHNDENHEDDEDDEDEEENCVLTVTCTQGCIVQAQTDPAAPQTTITCETRSESIPCETPEPTECTPTSTATTTTTTTTPAISGSCGSAGCGDGSCDISKRRAVSQKHERLAKRVQPPEDDSPILVDNFGELDNLDEEGRARWFVYARALIDKYSAGNGDDGVQYIPTSKMWDLDGLERPFITGAGPSWGCTTVIVYSNLGIYLAHLWEEDNFADAAGFEVAKDFIRNGNPAQGQPSFPEAAQRYFADGAYSVQALVFTPRTNSIRVRYDGSLMEEPQGGGRSTTNPWYKEQVDDLMGLIMEFVPTAHVAPLTYELLSDQQALAGEFGQQEKTLAVFQYSPRHWLQIDEDRCESFRSLRIIYPVKQVWGPITWRQGPVVLAKHKRADDACPVGAAPPSGEEQLFDENGEPLDPKDIGGGAGGTTPPPKTCGTAADCSSPDCAGGGASSACEEGVCVCKTPTPPPAAKTCSSDNECSGPECAGGMVVSKCEEGVCVCKSPEDPSICSAVDTCTYLECADGEERACTDGRCQCQEKTCSNADACGFLSCDADKEKACEASKCICKTKPPPFASGTCNTHIREYGNKDGFTTSIHIYDGAGTEIDRYGEVNTKHNWGDTITIPGGKLPYEMKYEFLDNWLGSMNKRDRPAPGSLGPDPLKYTTYSVRITAGATTWTTEDKDNNKVMLPRCEVGRWDTHGTWDPTEIIGDFIDGLMGNSGELPVSNTFDNGNPQCESENTD